MQGGRGAQKTAVFDITIDDNSNTSVIPGMTNNMWKEIHSYAAKPQMIRNLIFKGSMGKYIWIFFGGGQHNR